MGTAGARWSRCRGDVAITALGRLRRTTGGFRRPCRAVFGWAVQTAPVDASDETWRTPCSSAGSSIWVLHFGLTAASVILWRRQADSVVRLARPGLAWRGGMPAIREITGMRGCLDFAT